MWTGVLGLEANRMQSLSNYTWDEENSRQEISGLRFLKGLGSGSFWAKAPGRHRRRGQGRRRGQPGPRGCHSARLRSDWRRRRAETFLAFPAVFWGFFGMKSYTSSMRV